jgi:RND family efflux transporter MFP subunit
MRLLKKIGAYIKGLPLLYSVGGAIVVVIVLGFGVRFFIHGAATAAAPAQISHVQIASVASLASESGPLPLSGKVTSRGQATILAQTSGEIVSLSRALGDHVAAGQVIAQFDNASQAATVVQAQGAYAAAQASLAKASGTTATNSGITSAQAAQAAANAQTSVNASLQSTYVALDDAVHTKSDPLFSNPRGASPTLLSFTIPDSQLVVNIQNERLGLEAVLADARTIANSTSDTDARATAMNADALTVAAFLNDLVRGINQAVPSQSISASMIAADQAAIGSARSEVVNAIASLSAAKGSYDAAQSGAQTAANSASTGSDSDVALAKANVQQALGSLESAQAALDKTIVRSPISGTIVSLTITQGDFVSSFSTIAEVSNPTALEVDAYVTPGDAKTLSTGGSAVIDGNVKGVITSIAPAIDPSTGQIQVKIGIPGDQSSLTDGDTVSVSLSRSISSGTATTALPTQFTIPIVAAKITPTGPIVFTVSSSTLVANPIVLGTIVGDQVTVTDGLTPTMDIVTDARGLSTGEAVVVDSQ